MTARKMASNLDANGRRILNLPAPTAASTEAARQIDLETARTFAISRANHSGTQLASTISNFVATVQTVALNTLAVPTGPVALNGQRLTNVGEPSASTDGATKNYVDTSLAAVTSGQTFKGNVRALVKANVNTSSPGATLDGLTAANGDVFWLGAQTTGTENGPWVYNGASSAMTRPSNFNGANAVVGSYWVVTAGTSADTYLLMTNDTFTLGTNSALYKTFDVAAAATPAFEADMGDGASTSFVLTHNFNTRNVEVSVRRNASPYDDITSLVYFEYTSVNSITIAPDEVWSTAQFHAVIVKS